MKKLLLLLLLTPTLLLANYNNISLQVLGSGGPESGDKRASSSYILWIDRKSKILIDFGGGASLRFEEVGAKIEDLDVYFTHTLTCRPYGRPTCTVKIKFFYKSIRRATYLWS